MKRRITYPIVNTLGKLRHMKTTTTRVKWLHHSSSKGEKSEHTDFTSCFNTVIVIVTCD